MTLSVKSSAGQARPFREFENLYAEMDRLAELDARLRGAIELPDAARVERIVRGRIRTGRVWRFGAVAAAVLFAAGLGYRVWRPAPVRTSRSRVISCSQQRARSSFNLSPTSASFPIPAAPGFCRASRAMRVRWDWRSRVKR